MCNVTTLVSMLESLRDLIWKSVVRIHGDVRVVAFLRALSVVGMVGGIVAFGVGLNPMLGSVALAELPLTGEQLQKIGIVGLFVYLPSLFYYKATAPTGYREGFVQL